MNNTQRVSAVILVLLAMAVSSIATAQTTVYLSQPMKVGARALSFAGSVTGDNPDVTVMYVNPAALSFLDNSAIVATHAFARSANVMEENIGLPLFLRHGEVVGIALSVNHVGSLNKSENNNFKVVQYGYDVSYARRIVSKLSLGGTLNVRYAKSSGAKLWGLSSSFGAFYFPTPDVSYGLSITGIGSGIKYIYDGSNTLLNSENIPGSIHAGATMRFPSHVSRERLFTLSLAAEKTLEGSGIRYFGGFELIPVTFLALRVGYLGATDGTEYASYGVGFKIAGWKLDLGATPGKRSGELFQATLSVPLWNQLDEIN